MARVNDFSLRPDPDGHDQPGVWWLLAGDHRLVVQMDNGIGNHGATCRLTGPAGDGEAWISGEPAALELQLSGCRATIGGTEVLLRRNGPRLRRAARQMTVRGGPVDWTMRFKHGHGASCLHDRDGSLLWSRDASPASCQVADGQPAERLAAIALWSHLRLHDLCHVNVLRGI